MALRLSLLLCLAVVLLSSFSCATVAVSSNDEFPLCPITGMKPSRPNVTVRHCPDAREYTCCKDCTEVVGALDAVSANESVILAQISPILSNALAGRDVQLCSLFVGFAQCSIELQNMNCAVMCNPDSGNYVKMVGGVPTLVVCDQYASLVYEACKGVPVPGSGSLWQILPTKELMLQTIFGPIMGALGHLNVSLDISTTNDACYSGTKTVEPSFLCCDPLDPVPQCPVDVATHPQYAKFISRTLNPTECGNGSLSYNGTVSNADTSTGGGKAAANGAGVGGGARVVGMAMQAVAAMAAGLWFLQ
eukprot:TRINITY_DN4074_c0_g1_i1.p1 TRINITY_DN4074_c0_g1~~TRINITY_DN4074_c0_g1_i1.p1  ORF type:complete len:305 (+),score=-23.84 TRINITY_DN4074_c0_g1_i1:258-1172(+)